MLFKKKNDFVAICNNIYDNSLIITEKLNRIISNYGYSLKISTHKPLFCSITSLYCYFFFELVLRKYYNYSEDECFKIIYCLISELTSHLENVSFDQTFNVYIEIKNILSTPPKEQREEFISINYLVMAINFEEEEVDTLLLFDIYREFDTILKNAYRIK